MDNSKKNIAFEKIEGSVKEDINQGFLKVGRVILENKERYSVQTTTGVVSAELLGNLRYSATSKFDLPAVGDWVLLQEYDEHAGIIHKVLPRHTVLKRKAVNKKDDYQIIATNIDYAMIVQALGRDYSLNRLERYLTLCYESGIKPLIIFNKVDLFDENTLNEITLSINSRFEGVPIFFTSTKTEEGIEQLKSMMIDGATYCMLGSSGVGKSSLINNLSGEEKQETGAISESVQRGKHVTTNRELITLPNGSFIVDNPGIREVGIADSKVGLEETFNTIYELGHSCKFKNCSHTNEIGCSVLKALDSGEIEPETYANYLKLSKEQAHFASSVQERRQKEKKFSKMVKGVVNEKRKRKNK